MHIPDGLLDPITIIILWCLTIIVMVIGYFKLNKVFKSEDSDKMIPYIGVLAAVIFAFQFVNYPIPGGTSGHLIGGTLIAIILGPWASVIVLFLVLFIQSLFGDGGILALGANTFNMGVIGGIIGFYITLSLLKLLDKTSIKNTLKVSISTALGSYISIVLAAFIAGVEISVSGNVPFLFAITSMTFWHLFIGIGEAVITTLIVLYLFRTKEDLISINEIKVARGA